MFEYTKQELDKAKLAYFSSLDPLQLRLFPPKQKKKYIVLSIVIKNIEDIEYSEKELNIVLKEIYSDFVTLRRALIDFRFMNRTIDGSKYWIHKND